MQKHVKLSVVELPYVAAYTINQGFSKGVPRHTSVPRNFWTVPREKVLGKCEHIKIKIKTSSVYDCTVEDVE